MRALPALLLLAACGAAPAVPARTGGAPMRTGGTPMRIVSTDPCADAVLVRLVAPGRIAAISHYSQEPTASSIPPEIARRFHGTVGTAEEVIALHPDLVVASSFTPMATRDAYARAGLDTLVLGYASSIAQSEAQVMQIADATGTHAGGAALNAGIDRALAAVPKRRTRPPALLYISGELATGPGTLLDELMTQAGFADAATSYGLTHTDRLSVEALVAHPPAIVMTPEGDSRGDAMRRALLKNTRHAVFPRRLVNCGGPVIVPAIRRLAAIRATMP